MENFTSYSEEILEIVDENNNPIGAFESRFKVHRSDPIPWHRVTSIWIVNKDGKILCQKQSPNKTESKNVLDKWFPFFGGHVTKGTAFLDNAKKELEEEAGLKVADKDLKYIETRKSHSQHKHFIITYVLFWNGKLEDIKFNDGEISEVKWMGFDEIKKMIESDNTRSPLSDKIKEYFEKKMYLVND